MKLKKLYQESYLGRALSFLFKDNLTLKFADTLVGNLFDNKKYKIKNTKLTTIFRLIPCSLLLASIALLWYEAPLEAFWAPLGNDFLPFVLLIASIILLPKGDWIIRKYHLWYLGFLVASLISGIIGALAGYGGWEIIWGWAVYLQFGLAIAVGNLMIREKRLLPGLLLVSVPLLAQGALEFFTGNGGSRYSYLESAGMRADSFFESPNVFGFILVLLAILVTSILCQVTRGKNLYLVLTLVPILSLIYLTGSRTAWIALLVAGLVIGWEKGRKFFLYLVFSPLLLLVPRIRERVTVIFRPEYYFDASIDGRVWAVKNAWHVFRQNIFGTGPGTYGGRVAQINAGPVYLQSMQNGYTALYTTDNQWLSILVQTGILGILSFIGMLVSILVKFVSSKNAFGLALFVSLLVMMSFSNALEFGAVILPIALLLGRALAEE